MSDRQIQATTARDPRFETIRDMLSKRYNGVMDPISDEAVQAVLDEMAAEAQPSRPESSLCCTLYDIQCICRVTCPDCRCRCNGCTCGPLVFRPREQKG